ncbi:hypothetical protein [Glaciihabitans sp. UYNi722]|uniref:phage tail tube protein n=1 Tax=Glaciihabitans sp. UYNi722 TaxID=3156344 RepID=UPI0033913F66
MPSAYNSGQIRVAGTGNIYRAPLGTAVPTDSTTALSAAYVNVGYATNGFEVAQDRKTKEVTVWQSLEAARLIPTGLTRKFKFELQQSNKTTLALAWGGVIVPVTGTATGGAITIGTGGVLTTATAHGLAVGAPVSLATVVTSTGIVALTTYYVITVGSTTSLTLSATPGGTALTTTAGTGTGLTSPSGAYQLDLLDANTIADSIYVLEWFDGGTSQRIIIQQGSILTMPGIKYVRDDSVGYAFEVQAIKPQDGSDSVLIFGVDVAAVA